jgi:hypothetical protein
MGRLASSATAANTGMAKAVAATPAKGKTFRKNDLKPGDKRKINTPDDVTRIATLMIQLSVAEEKRGGSDVES